MGGVYGLQGVPNITAQAGGFRLCATKVGAQVTILHIKDMEDAAEAKEAALSLIAQSADVITGKLNAAEAGSCRRRRRRISALRAAASIRQKSRRTSFSQISSRIGRAVRQHFRPGEGRQAVRRLHAIRLRHGSGDRRFAALRGRQSCQPERSRRCRQATQRSAIPEAAWP
jgi:hypothetical protein